MVAVIVALLLIWLMLGVIGAVIKGLLWLAVLAALLFVVTGLIGGRGSKRIGS
jgi:hypothetical protein